MSGSPAAQLRARLDHPMLDADGHTVEYLPALIPYFQKAGVADDLKGFFERIFDPGTGMWGALCARARAAPHGSPVVVGRAGAQHPRLRDREHAGLIGERMEELGLDFSVIYPSMGLPILDIPDDRLRIAVLPGARTSSTPTSSRAPRRGSRPSP